MLSKIVLFFMVPFFVEGLVYVGCSWDFMLFKDLAICFCFESVLLW